MSRVMFIGCLHLGHEKLAKWRGWRDADEQDGNLILKWNEKVSKRDVIYILGDITRETTECYYKLDLLKGRKIVVLGNHDHYKDVRILLDHVESVAGFVEWHNVALTHAPIHPNEVSKYDYNIHAHIHHRNKLEEIAVSRMYDDEPQKVFTKDKYLCCDAHLVGYEPRTLDELVELNKNNYG
jgi:calcineurin-like phosphoesterase family protein